MNPIIERMMKPMLDNNINIFLNTLCRDACLNNLMALPRTNNNYFRWMLGRCEGKEDNLCKCKVQPENNHPTDVQIPDKYISQLVQMLQAGVDVVIGSHSGKKRI